jgi:histidine phosphotransferase ChpT
MEDMKLAALLCTRLCHDVIGPAGATVNGIELMSDDTASIDAGVVKLVQQSAAETTRRLKFFRISLGIPVEGQSLRDARTLAADYLELGRSDLDWPDSALDPGVPLPPILVPLSLNLILCAVDVLPRGGRIALSLTARGDNVALDIEASGEAIKLEDQLQQSLAGKSDLDDLDARSITPYVAARLIALGRGSLAVSRTETAVTFSASLPHGA